MSWHDIEIEVDGHKLIAVVEVWGPTDNDWKEKSIKCTGDITSVLQWVSARDPWRGWDMILEMINQELLDQGIVRLAE